MKTRKGILTVCVIAGVILFCVAALLTTAGIMQAKGYGISAGRLYLTDFGAYLIDENGGAMVLGDRSGSKQLFDGLNTGDLILVVHDGIEESYPARTGAYHVFRLRRGDATDLPKDPDLGFAQIGEVEDVPLSPTIDFEAQYIRTDGYNENVRYPVVKIIRSVRELNAYYEENKENYNLERRDTVYSDAPMGFLDACDKYDDAFFEDRILIMVLLEESSGSNRHEVQSVHMSTDGKCEISIDTIVPEIGTADMAQWHILIAPQAGTKVESASDVTVLIDGVNRRSQDFAFSLTWGTYGISSYDSSTGKLVKTTDATHPEDYVTEYHLTNEEKKRILGLISDLDMESYPDEYNPHGNGSSVPYMTLVLSVNANGIDKTVTAKETALSFEANNIKGQKFLDACRTIIDILTETEAWNALPEYEFFYD